MAKKKISLLTKYRRQINRLEGDKRSLQLALERARLTETQLTEELKNAKDFRRNRLIDEIGKMIDANAHLVQNASKIIAKEVW